MNCPQCQKPLPEDAKLCLHCGARIPSPAPTQRIGAVAIDATEGKNVIHMGTTGQPSEPAGDYCPICGAFNAVDKTLRCAHCGRAFLCLKHQDQESYWCHECVGRTEKQAKQLRGVRPQRPGTQY